MIRLKTITELQRELDLAKERRLIVSYEHIKNKDMLLVHLKQSTPIEVRDMVRKYIKTHYTDVMYVAVVPHENALYIRYQ